MHHLLETVDGAPWWANVTLLGLGLIVPLLILQVQSRREQAQMRDDLKEVHKQTVNDHSGNENMRDQLDRMADTLDRIERNDRRHDAEIARLADAREQDRIELHDFTQKTHDRLGEIKMWLTRVSNKRKD